jgi:clan AA aspartic protease (TIGR02281 family)
MSQNPQPTITQPPRIAGPSQDNSPPSPYIANPQQTADQSASPPSTVASINDRPVQSDMLKDSISVQLEREGGTYKVPVLINNAITLKFIVDSGASDVSIPADVALTLFRTGTLKASDFIGVQKYEMADGSTLPSVRFRIKSLTVGNTVIEDVIGGIAPIRGSLLLGQSFLNRFKSWSMDNAEQALVLKR